MPPSHKHSASAPAGLPPPEAYEQNRPSMEFTPAMTQYPPPPPPMQQQGGVNGMRYYPPMTGSALQLPNGEFVPYDVEPTGQGMDHGGVLTHQLAPPVGMLVPGGYYGLPQESMGSYEPTGGRLTGQGRNPGEEQEKRGRGNKQRNRNGGRGRGGGGSGRSRSIQKELKDNVKRTVYISDIDHQVTEEELANLFADTGSVVDCRVCGDPNSAKRFAFIEFSDEDGSTKALEKSGTMLGASAIRVLPSKTAIVPVNKDFMPRNMEEMELCSRTVYIANIDKKVDKHDVRRFFESLCGKVTKLRLLGDYAHSTRIAFIEFSHADSALVALSCTGAVLGTLPIRVAPSKAPVRMCSNSDCED
eukprot:g2146.t1